MKQLILFVVGLTALFPTLAQAQEQVTDPGLYSILNQQQTAILQQWTSQLQAMQNQLKTAESELTTAQSQLSTLNQLSTNIGNPAMVVGAMNITSVENELNTVQSLNPIGSLSNSLSSTVGNITSNPTGIFPQPNVNTFGGTPLAVTPAQTAPFTAVDNTFTNSLTTQSQSATAMNAITADVAATTAQIQTAPDQATVQKLQAKLQADQIAMSAIAAQQNQSNQQVSNVKSEADAQAQKKALAAAVQQQQDFSTGLLQFQQTGTVEPISFP